MKGLQADSYKVFKLTFIFYGMAWVYGLHKACLLLEPFLSISLAHAAWYRLRSCKAWADGIALALLIHWLYQLCCVLELQHLQKLAAIAAILASSLGFCHGFGWHKKNSKLISLMLTLTFMNAGFLLIMGFNGITLFVLLFIAMLVAHYTSEIMGSRILCGWGYFLALMSLEIKAFPGNMGIDFEFLPLVIGYILGLWCLYQGVRLHVEKSKKNNSLESSLYLHHFKSKL